MTSLIQPVPNYQNVACVAPFSALLIHSTNKVYPCCAYNYQKFVDLDESKDLIWKNLNALLGHKDLIESRICICLINL